MGYCSIHGFFHEPVCPLCVRGYCKPVDDNKDCLKEQQQIQKFDVSFMAYPVELNYEIKKEEPSLSQDSVKTEVADLFDNENDLKLTELYFDNKGKEKEEELQKKINQYRCFYLKNDKFWSISLKSKDLYKKFKDDGTFIGNKFKELFQDEEEMALMVQIVNERFELKSIGKYLFYREVYLHTYKNASIQKLFKTYVGNQEEQFLFEERENVLLDYQHKF